MAKSDDSKAECETIILMNELDSDATLYTATASVRREWESYGFPVQGDKQGWRCRVPKDRVGYKPMKKG
jgi:hypothetical protein